MIPRWAVLGPERFVRGSFAACTESAHAMRTDHFAYQQAVRVAGGGLGLQLALGLVLLVYGRIAGDTAFVIASTYVFACVPIWIGLTLVFNQHRLERIEALEDDELAATRDASTALFEKDGAKVAARRLRFMHTWLMPGVSLVVAASLVLAAWWVIDWFHGLDDPNRDIDPFAVGPYPGWQLAMAIALALAAFIVSRFIAGMARQPAWQNLRGGAAAMVGNALVLLAIAIGIVFHFFEKTQVLPAIGYGIAIFMIVVASEIVLNFVLNLYRPRRANETPRPAFDSKVLSLFAAPDSIVRSINEAVNYQFGFDITSSWGYQLLLRSVGRLVAFGLIVLVLLSCIAVIEPGQQALRLRFGEPRGGVYQQTAMFKLPWPFETAEIYDVGRVRTMVLGAHPEAKKGKYMAWGDDGQSDPSRNLWIVASPRRLTSGTGVLASLPMATAGASAAGDDAEPAAEEFALVDADVVLSYRVRDGELDRWLGFSNDAKLRRANSDMRERALRNLAMREVTQYWSTQTLSDVLAGGSASHAIAMQERIQASFDRLETGVQVVSVAITRLRPPGAEAVNFLEPSIAVQNARKAVETQRSAVDTTMTAVLGTPEAAREVVAAIQKLREIERAASGSDIGAPAVDTPEAIEQRLLIERLITQSQAQAAALVATARNERWRLHMDARRKAADVLGQAPAYETAPALFQQRKLMEAIRAALPGVRLKYILGIDPSRVNFEFDMQEGDAGLNIYDYVTKE
jgi:regulator of protease activity HflC (stomatin/prohibitin superfamily)